MRSPFGGDFMRIGFDGTNTYRQNGHFRFRGTQLLAAIRCRICCWATRDRFLQGGGEYAARRGNSGSLFFQDNFKCPAKLWC